MTILCLILCIGSLRLTETNQKYNGFSAISKVIHEKVKLRI